MIPLCASPGSEGLDRRTPAERRTALLVSNDGGLTAALSEELEAAAYEVLACPGPHDLPRGGPSGCVGLQQGNCPLVSAASIVILDLHPEGNSLVDMSSRRDLVSFYGSRVDLLVLLEDDDSVITHPGGASGEVSLPRETDPAVVIDTIREVRTFAEASSPSP